jgi:hypothetical protein
MPDVAISGATAKASLVNSDMIPVAASGSTTAYKVTGETLFNSIPQASTSVQGKVELATAAETRAATDTARAITPAGLANSVGPKQLYPGFCFAGKLAVRPPTGVTIYNKFLATFGRVIADGDVLTILDNLDDMYLLCFSESDGGFHGIHFNLSSPPNHEFVSYF